MGLHRVGGDSTLLPNGDVVINGGAQTGCMGGLLNGVNRQVLLRENSRSLSVVSMVMPDFYCCSLLLFLQASLFTADSACYSITQAVCHQHCLLAVQGQLPQPLD
jgi:hypothetical protein